MELAETVMWFDDFRRDLIVQTTDGVRLRIPERCLMVWTQHHLDYQIKVGIKVARQHPELLIQSKARWKHGL